ncbi:MAG: universal stress protein, partial [Syntrophobacterales bacterium]|nr:universal stress protein [Syntrophobacterales bacterium]
MSTHGRHGITRLAFGSVTDKVLRRGKTPVLIVRMPNKG